MRNDRFGVQGWFMNDLEKVLRSSVNGLEMVQ